MILGIFPEHWIEKKTKWNIRTRKYFLPSARGHISVSRPCACVMFTLSDTLARGKEDYWVAFHVTKWLSYHQNLKIVNIMMSGSRIAQDRKLGLRMREKQFKLKSCVDYKFFCVDWRWFIFYLFIFFSLTEMFLSLLAYVWYVLTASLNIQIQSARLPFLSSAKWFSLKLWYSSELFPNDLYWVAHPSPSLSSCCHHQSPWKLRL